MQEVKHQEITDTIQKVKQILQNLHLNTFQKYREAGKEIIASGYLKGKWDSQQRKKALEEWAISQWTFSCMSQLGKMREEQFSDVITKFPSVYAWTHQPRKEKLFEYSLYNVWNFGKCDDRFGITDFEGRIPGQIIMNLLYYFTNEGDLIVDPMAGSGTTIDVCKFMHRNCNAYDINPVRDDIQQYDITKGFPDASKNCDLIFLDPPYFNMVFDFFENVEEFYGFIKNLALNCFNTVKDNGIVAFLMEDMTEKGNHCLSGESYRIFRESGFEVITHVSCPLSTQQFLPQQVEMAKKEKRMLGRNRDLYVFRKPKNG